jgi:hypothetical protein
MCPSPYETRDVCKMALPALSAQLITGHQPNNHATNIPVNQAISVTFQRDIDVNSINTSTFRVIANSTGEEIKGDVSYNRRVATFTPHAPLEPAETYQVILVGKTNVNNPNVEGIQDILGNPLYGNYTWTFSTVDSPTITSPDLIEPLNETFVDKTRIEFSWMRPEGAMGFELQVAKDRNFRIIVWPKTPAVIANTSVLPNIEFEDGQYYWRVRAIDSRKRPGRWSDVWTFSVDTVYKGTVSPEDETPPEIVDYGYLQPLEVAELFPEEGATNIDLNLGAIVIKVLGDISPNEVTGQSIRVYGNAIAKDEACRSHGEVDGSVSVFKRDGFTYIVFQPEPLI